MCILSFEEIISKIVLALQKISDTNSSIWQLNEVSICSRVASNLREIFQGYDVDIELQKHNARRPDIVIHKLGTNEKNLVVFQVKKRPSVKDIKEDLAKINETFFSEPYCYKYGIFISVGKLPKELPDFSIDRIRFIQVYGFKITSV